MTIIPMRGAKEAPRAERSRMETLLLTPDIVNDWRLPPFQRPLRVNAKVMEIAEQLKQNGGIIEGVISLGQIKPDKVFYLYDGQHRIEAARISGLPEFIADVRIVSFDSMSEMGVEFVKLNSVIVRLKPDDVMRGLEQSLPCLREIRKACPFVGYDNIRRNPSAPLISMSSAMRCWRGSAGETPSLSVGSAMQTAHEMTATDTEEFIRFLLAARSAWGSDPEYGRLWGNLNLVMIMWLWRRLVLDRERGVKRYVVLSIEQFRRCMMSLHADSDYLDYLVNRAVTDRDRPPCYTRIKGLFVRRLREAGIQKPLMPQPAWATK